MGKLNNATRYWSALLLLLLAGVLTSCDQGNDEVYSPQMSMSPAASLEKVYVFSVHPLHNPTRLHEIFDPLMEYLSRNIEGATFRLEASRNYAAYEKKLYSGNPDFSLPNPYQTVESLKHGYSVFGKMGDDQNFRGIILVRRDGNIKTVNDLKGKAISYPAPTALAATMLPQYFLHSQGLNITKDLDNRYVGSQESSVMNLYLGNVSAAATWPPPWRAMLRERPELADVLMVKWRTQTLPNNGLVVRSDVPQAIREQVAELLFTLNTIPEGRVILQRMELSKFVPATDKTYDPVREFLATFAREVRPIN